MGLQRVGHNGVTFTVIMHACAVCMIRWHDFHAVAKLLLSCLTLCDPIDYSPPGSSVQWNSPGKNTGVDCHVLLQDIFLNSQFQCYLGNLILGSSPVPFFLVSLFPVWHSIFTSVLVTQLCLTLCNPTDCSLPDSSVHGILQIRIMEWVAIAFSRVFSLSMDRTWVSCIAERFFTVWATREAHLYKNPKAIMDVEMIIWNEVSQTEKDIRSFICRIEKIDTN